MKLNRAYFGVILFLVMVLVLGITIWEKKEPVITDQVTVTKGSISNSVKVFGKAEPQDTYTLAFEVGGTINSYPFEVGEKVTTSQVLAAIDATTINNQINETRSKVTIESRKRDELAAPVRSSELLALESQVEQSNIALQNQEKEFDQQIKTAAVDLEALFNRHIDGYFREIGNTGRFDFDLDDAVVSDQTERNLELFQKSLLDEIALLKEEEDIEAGYAEATNTIGLFTDFSTEIRSGLRVGTKDNVEDDVRDNTNELLQSLATISSTLLSQNNLVNQASQARDVAINNLEVARVGATPETIALQDSIIRDKQVSLNSLFAEKGKYSLESPIDGVVFQTFVDQFESVSPNEAIIAIVPDEPLVVRADVAESDIVYVGVGNQATITFDALPGQSFNAQVSFVENTIDESKSVPTYETTFIFDQAQDLSAIKSGMTANILVNSGFVNNIVFIPTSYLSQDTGVVFVQGANQEIIERQVTTGYRTNTGLVEITSGLNEGDVIVLTQ